MHRVRRTLGGTPSSRVIYCTALSLRGFAGSSFGRILQNAAILSVWRNPLSCPKDTRRNPTATGNLFVRIKSIIETGDLFCGSQNPAETGRFSARLSGTQLRPGI